MVKYRDAEKKDCYEIIDLMNYVFKVDFEKVLPKTFNRDFDFEKITKVAEDENGRLISCVCVLPQQLTVGDSTLNTNFLGGVTVHPRQISSIVLIREYLKLSNFFFCRKSLQDRGFRLFHFGVSFIVVCWHRTKYCKAGVF